MKLFCTRLLFVAAFLFAFMAAHSQVSCPSNIDFELGNLQGWSCFTSTNSGTGNYSWAGPVTPISNRHTIVTGSGTDPYGGFPVVAPGGGSYSLKLGNNASGSQMEQVRYSFIVPANQNEYAVIYRYAIVLEDPGHTAIQQPFFKVRAYNTTTGATVNCGNFNYVSSSSLPGFTYFSRSGNYGYYKNWATASLNLSGQAGNSITLEFTTSDCSPSAHFGYAYIDMNCGLFSIQNLACVSSPTAPLSAPPGFQSYTWYDSTYSNMLGTGQSVVVPNPTQRTVYRVKLVPYPGYGCTDTLSTVIVPASLNLNAGSDTALCNQSSFQLSPTATGSAPPFNYSWTSSSGFSCTNCPTPTVSPTTATNYYLTVTDANNCTARDTVKITPTVGLTANVTPVSCFGGSDGSIAGSLQNGTPPFTYQWNNTQTSTSINNLVAGTYTISIVDAKGCASQPTVVVPQPAAALSATISASQNVLCRGGNTGTATVTASGGTAPYSYSWNTTPIQTTATASNLISGNYTVTVTDAKGCIKTATVSITQPTVLNASVTKTDVACRGGNNGTATVTATGGTAPYTYSWNTTPVQVAATATGLPAGGYTVTVTDANGCIKTVNKTITQPATLNAVVTKTSVLCNGDSTGTATVAATGGTAPYSYSWNTTPVQTTATASGLPVGSYMVTVTDTNGCVKTASVTVSQPTVLTTTTTQTDVLCNGGNTGTATVTATGGTTSYTYSWNTTPAQTTATATALISGNYTVTVTDANGCVKTASANIAEPAILTAATTQTNVSCNSGANGTATVTTAGGIAPYTYSWNSTPVQTTATASNLISGNYTITVTDSNGCTQTASAAITQPAALNATIAKTNVSCRDGSNGAATVTATGGTAPYVYSWNTIPAQTTATAGNLIAGNYTVTVTDTLGCTQTASTVITQPAALTATATKTDVLCNGGNTGTATVTAAGGTAPYAYSWNTTPIQTTATATALISGNYTATVTDTKGCVKTATVAIAQPTILTASATNTNVSCNGGSNGTATVTATGGTAPYAYSWNTTPAQTTAIATGLISGNYTVTVTDANNCSQTVSVNISQPAALAASTTKTDVLCNGGNTGTATVTATGGTTPYSYSWNTTPVQTTATASNLVSGNYTVTVTDSNSCTQTASVVISQPTVLSATATNTHVSCNGGSNGTATVTATGGTAPYSYSWSTTPAQTTATASNLVSGNYTVTVTDANNCIQTASVVISQPAVLTATATKTDVLCNGGNTGTAMATAAGGTTPYAYSWNTTPVQATASANNLSAGTYTVTVTDAQNCAQTATVIVSQPASLSATATKTDVLCNGGNTGTATATATGGTAPYAYSWNTTPVQTTAIVNGLVSGNYTVTATDSNGCTQTASVVISQPTALAATATKTDVLCNGGNTGTATATATGGTTPYTYSWNTTPVQTTAIATGLVSGNYTVTITDANNCTQTASVIVSQPAILAASTTKTDVLCNGGNTGTATVVATGGTAPYSYSWNTTPVQTTATANGLISGNYTVTITDANNCSQTASANIAQPSTLSATALGVDVSCNGGANGTATVTATGGTAPYTYSWNTTPVQTTATASNLVSGNYTVTVTDANNCSQTASVIISQPTALTAAATQTSVLCNGGNTGTATAVATGGTTPYSYSWNTTPIQTTATATGLISGNYTVTITDGNGCIKTASVTVLQPTTLAATVSNNPVSCNGGSNGTATVTATGGTVPYTYSWNTTPVQTTATANSLVSGNYTVTVTDANGCAQTETTTVTQPAALTATATSTNVFCNGGNTGTATVIAAGGTAPYSYSWNTTPIQTTATASNLVSGNYTVTVTDANNCSQTASVVISQPTALAATATTTNVSCNGGNNGTAMVTAAGGTAPYTYSWNTTPAQTTAIATGLISGNYTVTVTDANNCSQTASVVVSQPAVLAASATKTDVLCNGGNTGTATVTATGGTAPYTYSWNTTPVQTTAVATALPVGSYTATVTDVNGCTQTASAVISQPTTLNATATKTDVSCNGGSNGTATVTAAGGTAPYSYSWNTTPAQTTAAATGLVSGNYTVTVTDANNCSQTASVNISQPAALTATTSQTNVLCNGGNTGTATVTATGGVTPYSYSWNTTPVQTTATATGLISGNYSVTVTDSNGCVQTKNLVIVQPALLAASTTKTDVLCNGGNTGTATAIVTGGTTPYAYSWNTTPVQTTAAATGLISGNYTVTVTDANGCTQTASVVVSQPAVLAASTTKTDVLCNGGNTGTATVTATGGTTPYSYSWNTTPVQTTATANNLAVGNYTVMVTDAKGCSQTATATISQPVVLTATTTPTAVSCNGGNNGAATVAVTGGTAPYSYSWNTTPAQTTATANSLVSGNYTVTVTDAMGCTKTALAAVSQPAALATTLSGTNVSCNGGTNGIITATVAGGTAPYAYSWNTTPVQTTATATGLISGNYTVTVTDANGCIKTTSTIITQPTALAMATAQTNIVCNGGNTGTATVTATGGTAPYTYSWNTTPIQTTATASNLVSGNYTVTVTDANNCSQTASVIITQPTILAASTTKTDVSCNGGSNGTASVAVTGGTAPYAYSWNTTPVQTTATANNLIAGNYTVAITDTNGCSQTATINITQPAVLTATASGTSIACNSGNTGTATVTAIGGTAPYTYSWNTTPAQTTATANSLTAGSYTVIITDSKNCQTTANATVTQPTTLSLAVSKNDLNCYGMTNGTAMASATGGTTPYSFSWNTIPALPTPISTTPNMSGLAAGTYAVTVTDANGCLQTATVILMQPDSLSLIITGTNLRCHDDNNGSATATVTGGTQPYAYVWNNNPALNGKTYNSFVPGTHSVAITDAMGCTRSSAITLTSPPAITAIFMVDSIPCFGAASGIMQLANVAGGQAPYQYLWLDGSGSTTASRQNLRAGSYTIRVTDSLNCAKDFTQILRERPSLNLDAGVDTFICGGSTVQLQATGTAVRWQWSPSAGLSCTNCTNPFATPQQTTTYLLTIEDAFGCQGTDSVKLTVQPRKLVSAGKELKICFGDSALLSAAGGDRYEWFPASSLTGAQTDRPTATPDATTQYQVIITQGNCFSDTLYQQVTVAPLPEIHAGQDVRLFSGGQMTLQVTGSSDIKTYSWKPFVGLNCYDCRTPTVIDARSTTYIVTATTEHGCQSSDTLNVQVACDGSPFYVANTFTPNGDGLDDYFYPQGTGIVKINRMMVQSKWGEIVFERSNFPSNDPGYGWDGSFKGQKMDSGTFLYIIEAICNSGEPLLLKGDINLIR